MWLTSRETRSASWPPTLLTRIPCLRSCRHGCLRMVSLPTTKSHPRVVRPDWLRVQCWRKVIMSYSKQHRLCFAAVQKFFACCKQTKFMLQCCQFRIWSSTAPGSISPSGSHEQMPLKSWTWRACWCHWFTTRPQMGRLQHYCPCTSLFHPPEAWFRRGCGKFQQVRLRTSRKLMQAQVCAPCNHATAARHSA